ncbi:MULTISPECIES: acyl-CoA thioesterase [Streptomyces]|uniref:acyl-CoA thioesterase n=1 Tax=Streptomyces TaxID=1883 RepID=UPI00081B8D40|nr:MULTISPECIES: acyl-CoA thioesterase [unclassified Streptomyces]MYQ50424.1 thioesterase [Streptomyces sp. SID4941]SCD40094.1 acyl-CoA thioester hydrolase [Streptomyces sp. PalvLS-984]SDC30469.1 acyl-CoA thioester hydrolase [Streptomyces sp. AmelKG-A3]
MTYFTDVTVRGYELDTQGHLNQAVYLQYAEHARWELLRAAGVPQEKMLAAGIGPVQLEVTVKYRRELRGGERVRVSCAFVRGAGKVFEIRQRVTKEDGTVAAEIGAVGGVLDLSARKLIPDPLGRLASLADKPELLEIEKS